MLLIKYLIKIVIRLKSKGKVYFGEKTKINTVDIISSKKSKIIINSFVRIARGSILKTTENSFIDIGTNTSMNINCQIYGDVFLGKNCILSSEVYISSLNHDFKSSPYLPIKISDKKYEIKSRPIFIEDDVWIGKNVIIFPGVYIAKGCVIGVNSIIKKDILQPYLVHKNQKEKYTRFKILKSNKIVMDEKNIPNFYRGFELKFDTNNKLYDIVGKDVVFLLNPNMLRKNVNVSIENIKSNPISLNIYPNNISVELNGSKIINSMDTQLDDDKLVKFSKFNKFVIVKMKFIKLVSFVDLQIKLSYD